MQEVQIAQRAPPLLHIRLDQKGAVAVAAMARRALGLLDADEVRRAQFGTLQAEASTEFGEQRFLADQATGIEQRRANGCVVARLGQAFVDRAGGVPDLEPQIP